jgi:hypothetical protein
MKKLALASVAFAGITAFGAGNSFAAAPTFYSSVTAVPWNDNAIWEANGLGGPTLATAGPVTSPTNVTMTTSVVSTLGVHVEGSQQVHLAPGNIGASASLLFGIQNSAAPHLGVNGGFPNNTHVLYGSTTGQMGVHFSKPVKGFGFYVSPIPTSDTGSTFNAFVEVFGKTTGGTTELLGSKDAVGTIDMSCSAASCTFVGATTSGNPNIVGITNVLINVDMGPTHNVDRQAPLPPGISNVLLESAAVPEPASMSILGAGLLGLGALRRRRQSTKPGGAWRWSPFGRWRFSNRP